MGKEPVKQTVSEDYGGTRIEESHPAFGLIRLSKCYGNHGPMFGNSIPNCQSYVSISICRGSRIHKGYDTYFPGKEIIRLDMSESQFAEMMTTWNRGEGTPVTLRNIDGNPVPDIEEEKMEVDRVRDHFSRSSELAIKQVREAKREINDLLNKKSLTKADRAAIREAFRKVESWVSDSAPFIAGLFDEAAQKTVSKAKVEINAFMKDAVIAARIDQAKNPMQLMEKIGKGNEETDNSKGR